MAQLDSPTREATRETVLPGSPEADLPKSWVDRARQVLPAGTFGNFAGEVVLARGEGARVWAEDGTEYVDYLIGSGPMLVGHGHPEVLAAVQAQLPDGFTFFTNNAKGIELAEVICAALPCAEQVRYVCTGSEADMYAVRLARAHTGREKILKFEGGYHGMSDVAQMSLAPKRLQNFPQPVPDSAGILRSVEESTLVAPFNDLEAVRAIAAEHGSEIAGILVEPFQRLIPPVEGFLEGLRQVATEHGILLIFDEVVTGFRLAYGGAQEVFGVVPDICTLGKVIGGGFPLAAIAGSEAVMRHFDKAAAGPEGFLMQLGTLSGNPVAAVAGLKTLEILARPGTYERIAANGRRVMAAIEAGAEETGIAARVVGMPCLFDVVFTDREVRNYRDCLAGEAARMSAFNAGLRRRGVLKPDSKFYISAALTDGDLARTETAIRETFRELS